MPARAACCDEEAAAHTETQLVRVLHMYAAVDISNDALALTGIVKLLYGPLLKKRATTICAPARQLECELEDSRVKRAARVGGVHPYRSAA
eukprot:892939-Pleurochrysis_carterae.AAC.2